MGRRKDMTPLVDKKLTRRQTKFVKTLVSMDGQVTNRQAAEMAGYPPSSRHTRAWELMNPNISPHVVKAIEEYRAELDAQYAVNYKRSERALAVIGKKALEEGAFSAAVNAEVARGKLAGLYTSKSEIRTGSIAALSREEVERELEKIRRSYGEITIDITPEEAEASAPEHRSGPLERPEDEPSEDREASGANKD